MIREYRVDSTLSRASIIPGIAAVYDWRSIRIGPTPPTDCCVITVRRIHPRHRPLKQTCGAKSWMDRAKLGQAVDVPIGRTRGRIRAGSHVRSLVLTRPRMLRQTLGRIRRHGVSVDEDENPEISPHHSPESAAGRIEQAVPRGPLDLGPARAADLRDRPGGQATRSAVTCAHSRDCPTIAAG